MQRRLAAVLAADVVGYSRLIEQDEIGTLAALKERWASIIAPVVASHKGRIVKVMGDGVLVEFGSTTQAVLCARELQQRMGEANEPLEATRRIVLRIGIHLDEIVIDAGDIYGDGVIQAVRLQQAAEPGDILVSAAAYEQVRHRLPFPLREAGSIGLKNSDRQLAVYSALGESAVVGPTATPQSAADKSVLVVPFANLSRSDDAYLTDGITEDIIIDLSQIPGLAVKARHVSFTLKDEPSDPVDLARRMRVSHVLTGSMRVVAQRVRITAQLIEGRTGVHLWAERFDSRLDDIFELQAQIASRVAAALSARLGDAGRTILSNKSSRDVEAYKCYLKGRSVHLLGWGNAERIRAARSMFEQATLLDPGYARAYAGIADCDAFLWVLGDLEISHEQMLANSSRALQIMPNLAEGHASLGLACYLAGKHAEAEKAFARANALNAELFETNFFYAMTLRQTGQFERAAEFFEKAEVLAPFDPLSVSLLADVYKVLGRESDRQAARRRALSRFEAMLADRPGDGHLLSFGAIAFVELGRFAEARKLADQALALEPENFGVRYNCACTFAVAGDNSEAMTNLNYIFDSAPRARQWLLSTMKHDSQMESLRSLETYKDLIRKLEAD